jgi:hypothetical protein
VSLTHKLRITVIEWGLNRIVSDHIRAQMDSYQTVAEEIPVRSKAVGLGFVVNISGTKVKVVAAIHNDFYMMSSSTAEYFGSCIKARR